MSLIFNYLANGCVKLSDMTQCVTSCLSCLSSEYIFCEPICVDHEAIVRKEILKSRALLFLGNA
jgi:hypothetical protein